LTTPSTRSAPEPTRIHLPRAATAGRKEEELDDDLVEKADGHYTLIQRPPDQDGLAGNPPPEGLDGSPLGRPHGTVQERLRRRNHQAAELRLPDTAKTSSPATTAGRGRGQPPPAATAPSQGLIRGPARRSPSQRHHEDGEEEDSRAKADLAPEIQPSP
jgi:hypothetical protein